jgi:apolipoprotein N-acyltransferase
MAAPALQQPDVSPSAPEGAAKSPVNRRERWLQLALAALSGLLYVVAFPGLNQFYLAFIAFVPVLWASHQASPRRALVLGVVMGLASHLIAYYWLTHMLQTFAFVPWAVAAIGWVLICLGQGASYGVGVGLSRWLRLKTGWPYALTLAIGLAAMDFVYPLVFPSYIANTMNGVPWMMQICDLFGVLGLTAIIGAINGAIVDVLIARREQRPFPKRTVALVGALWIGTLGYGALRTAQVDAQAAAAPKLKVGMVQSNVGGIENLKARARSLAIFRQRTEELHAQGMDLVVWPEGAVGHVIPPSLNVRDSLLQGTPQALLFGGVRVGADPHRPTEQLPYNSAFLADETGKQLGSYDKTILLVFGEYIPGGDFFPKLYEWVENASHWGRGRTTEPLVLRDWKLGTYICYEDILPRFVQTIMAPHNGERPDVMVNITNDSWYGPYMEQAQHLALAAFRTVEHHRALVRSTNTGISAFIDPVGRVTARTPMFEEATLTGTVPKMTGTTVYEVIGDVVGYASLLTLAWVWLRARRQTRRTTAST